jgi:hypothetical protein
VKPALQATVHVMAAAVITFENDGLDMYLKICATPKLELRSK